VESWRLSVIHVLSRLNDCESIVGKRRVGGKISRAIALNFLWASFAVDPQTIISEALSAPYETKGINVQQRSLLPI
jgi:hypothetical protein